MKSFKELTETLNDLRESKSKRYGSLEYPLKQIDTASAFAGITSEQLLIARILDKLNRISIMIQAGEKSADMESLIDSALDGANYFIFLAMAFERDDARPQIESMLKTMKSIQETTKERSRFPVS